MKFWTLTLPGKPAKLYASEITMLRDVLEAAEQGLYGRVFVTTEDTEKIDKKPNADLRDYIIDNDGDRWDYFPARNQYRLRTLPNDVTQGYDEGIGFWPQWKIIDRFGVRYNSSLR